LSRQGTVKLLLVFRRGNVPQRFQQSLGVEPGDPFQRGVLDVVGRRARPVWEQRLIYAEEVVL